MNIKNIPIWLWILIGLIAIINVIIIFLVLFHWIVNRCKSSDHEKFIDHEEFMQEASPLRSPSPYRNRAGSIASRFHPSNITGWTPGFRNTSSDPKFIDWNTSPT